MKRAPLLRAATITTNIIGGLGNQLFQVANLVATANRCGLQPWLTRATSADSCDDPRPTYWTSLLERLPIPEHMPEAPADDALAIVPEPPSHAVAAIDAGYLGKFATPGGTMQHYNLVGFFQSDIFFRDINEEVKQLLMPPEYHAVGSRRKDLLNKHDGCRVVGMHVRRGDYLKHRDVFHVLEHTYYLEALETLHGGLLTATAAPRVLVLIFSEDKRWAQTLGGVIESKYRSARAIVVGGRGDAGTYEESVLELPDPSKCPVDVGELALMAQCDDVVIANSSFSWWGAHLNTTPLRRVVAPANWFVKEPFPSKMQLYCPRWTIL